MTDEISVAFYNSFSYDISRIRTVSQKIDVLSRMQEAFQEAVLNKPSIRDELSRIYQDLKIECEDAVKKRSNLQHPATRQQCYENKVCNMSKQISQLLDSGYSVEISKSRSGLKLCKVSRKYEQVGKGAAASDISRDRRIVKNII